MSRPYFTTHKGQKTALWIGNALSLLLLATLSLQLTLVESPRTKVPQLESSNLTYCEVLTCGKIESIANLEPVAISITEGDHINTVRVEFVNHGRLVGSREFRIEFRDANGNWLESAKATLELTSKGRLAIDFGLTHPKQTLESGILNLVY